MTDQLVEIEPNNWHALKHLYSADGYDKYIPYITIDNYIRWSEQDPNLKHVKFYCLNGDYSDGTFVVTDRCHAYADTFDTSTGHLARLLQLIDYTKRSMFLCIRPEVQQVIHDVLKAKNVAVLFDDITLLYHLPKEEAIKFDVQPPKGITLRPITELQDYEKVNSVWSLRDTNSLAFFQRMGKFNTNVGAFKDDGTLVAWLFRFQTGLHAALQTDENHYGHGYGTLVVKHVSKKIAEMGHDIYSDIFESNKASRSLYEKLGFKAIGPIHWIAMETSWSPADE